MASILIVDDSPTTVEVLKVHLMGKGHVFRSTANPEEALEIARHEVPDLIISDLAMPRVSGVDLCKSVRSEAALKYCPFIIVTSKYDAKTRREAFAAGADAFLKKPIDPVRLSALVMQLLNR